MRRMSKREFHFKLVIAFLFLGVLTTLCVEIFNPECIIVRLIPVILSLIGSILALIMPYNYVYEFSERDWKDFDDGQAIITIPQKLHGFPKGANAVVYHKKNGRYSECICDIDFDENNTIRVIIGRKDLAFDGRVIIN